MPKDTKKPPKGLAIMIGMGMPKKGKGAPEGPSEPRNEVSGDDAFDAAIEEMFMLAAEGDIPSATAAFKDLFDVMHDKSHGWSGNDDGDDY